MFITGKYHMWWVRSASGTRSENQEEEPGVGPSPSPILPCIQGDAILVALEMTGVLPLALPLNVEEAWAGGCPFLSLTSHICEVGERSPTSQSYSADGLKHGCKRAL